MLFQSPVTFAHLHKSLTPHRVRAGRIKTNTSEPADDYLVLPVEVEVSAQPGLFCPLQRLDFGLVAAGSPPRQLWLPLLNSANKPIQLQVSGERWRGGEVETERWSRGCWAVMCNRDPR